jgi:hypothetical protein
MFLRHVLSGVFVSALLCLLVLNPVVSFSETEVEKKSETEKKDEVNPLVKVIEKTLGKKVNVIHIDNAEESRISGLKQIRVWVESVYGETPILFYITNDSKMYIAGSIFDSEGNNLTRIDVGETKPKVIKESEMELNDDYRIGPKDAKVRAVLWIGSDPFSKIIFDTFYSLYEKNKDKMSIYIKFYPRSERDVDKISLLTCVKGDDAIELYKNILNAVPGWGSNDDIEAFKEKHGLKDKACNKELIKNDLKLSINLKLPRHPVAIINGTLLIEEHSKANISKLSGVELK